MMQWMRPVTDVQTLRARAALTAVLLGAVCLAPTGCQQPPGSTQRYLFDSLFQTRQPLNVTTAPADADAAAAPASLREPPVAALLLSFDVLRTQVPKGTFSESGKIWNHLDEQVAPASVAATLQRNGLRIARGKVTSWAPIKALLDAEKDVTCAQNSMTVGNGLPLTLELDAKPHDQTLFLLRPDGSCPGATLLGSMNLLRIEYLIPVTSPDSVMLEMMPEIRLQPAEPAISSQGWAEPPLAPPARVFRELAVRVQIGPDEFLAVGPSSAAHLAHTIGSLMLAQEIEGRRYECMFFITPRVVRRAVTIGTRLNTAAPAGTPAR